MKAPEWLLFWTQRAFWMDGARMNRSRSCVWVLIVWKENYSPLPPNSRPRACSFVRGRRWKKQAPVLLSFLSPSSSSSSSSSSDKEIFHGRDESSSRPPSQRSHQITSIIIVAGARVCASDWIFTQKSTHETIPRIEGRKKIGKIQTPMPEKSLLKIQCQQPNRRRMAWWRVCLKVASLNIHPSLSTEFCSRDGGWRFNFNLAFI